MRNAAWLGLASAIFAIGCGSDSTPGPGEGSGGQGAGGASATGGSAGSDGSATGGDNGSGGAAAGSCEYNGQTYADGSSFPADDNCNTCGCNNGMVACTLMACEPAGTGGSTDCAGQPCGAQACTIEVQCFAPPCLPVDGYCDANGQCVEVQPSC